MGVYIKGMEMPTSCARCRCVRGCKAVNDRIKRLDKEPWLPGDHRHSDCPLIPVPPHGRLIDADALAVHKFVCIPKVIINGKDAGSAYRLGWNSAIEAIMENAETIIGGE